MECSDESDTRDGWPDTAMFKVTQDLYQSYKDSLKGSGKRVEDDETFGGRLKALTGVSPTRPAIGGQRRRGYALPALHVCRSRFAEFMHATDDDMDWPAV